MAKKAAEAVKAKAIAYAKQNVHDATIGKANAKVHNVVESVKALTVAAKRKYSNWKVSRTYNPKADHSCHAASPPPTKKKGWIESAKDWYTNYEDPVMVPAAENCEDARES
jgi:hypothetical protein